MSRSRWHVRAVSCRNSQASEGASLRWLRRRATVQTVGGLGSTSNAAQSPAARPPAVAVRSRVCRGGYLRRVQWIATDSFDEAQGVDVLISRVRISP